MEQAHHIIGQQFEREFGDFLRQLGFEIQSPGNLINLPASDAEALRLLKDEGLHASPHTGRHLRIYTETVERNLQAIRARTHKVVGLSATS